MKNKTSKIFIIGLVSVLFSFALSSCNNGGDKNQGTNIDDPNIRLEIKGKLIHVYKSKTWQLCYNDSDKTFTVTSDNGADYYSVIFQEMPSKEGQHLTAELRWTQNGRINAGKYNFEVLKIDTDGLITLHSNEDKIAVTIKQLN